jgi:hypothetical protein
MKMEARQWTIVGVTAVAAGAGALAVYHYTSKRRAAAAEAAAAARGSLTATIEKKHIAWVASMAAAYTSGDCDCAVRVLLDYVAADGPEQAIFEHVRCNTCGGKKDKEECTYTVTASHVRLLDGMVAKHRLEKGVSKALRCIVEFAMSEDGVVDDIFTAQRVAACL